MHWSTHCRVYLNLLQNRMLMRILLDHIVPMPLRKLLIGHQVETAYIRGLHDSINWIPQASGDMSGWHKLRHSHEILVLSPASCLPLVSPLAAIFRNFSLNLRVTQYFLVTARKVNGFAAIVLVSSSQLPFLG